MKPTVFLDFDDLLFETRGALIDFLNQYYGIDIPQQGFLCGNSLPEIINSYLPEGTSISYAEFYEQVGKNFIQSKQWHENISPILGAEKIIPLLGKRYILWVVTARQIEGLPVIHMLLDRFFPNLISGVHCVWKHLGNGEFLGKPKREFVSEYNGNKIAFFDDNPDEVREMLGVIPSYLFDPNRQHDHHTDIPNRVTSWEQIAAVLL